MKKGIAILTLCLCLAGFTYGQELTKKQSRKILEKAWNYVKTNDTTDLIKMWVLDNTQWPYHSRGFSVQDIKDNYYDFKNLFDSALIHNLKFDEVDCDSVEKGDDHRYFAKYHIAAWFKYNNHIRKGFGFYMGYVNNNWYFRFSPDYLYDHTKK